MFSRLQEQLKQRAQMKDDGIEEGILDAKCEENNSNNRFKVRWNDQKKNMQLVLQHYCKTSWIAMVRVLPPTENLFCNKSGC